MASEYIQTEVFPYSWNSRRNNGAVLSPTFKKTRYLMAISEFKKVKEERTYGADI